jgi:Na+/H+-dicarboxylate symporter
MSPLGRQSTHSSGIDPWPDTRSFSSRSLFESSWECCCILTPIPRSSTGSISRFVLTVGSTANQNGTAPFEGITILFLAQVYSIDLTLAQQIQVVLMSILAGIGTAGVPGGSLPLIMILLTSLGIPAEGMGLVLGVDRFLDMCRTTLNVSGDLVIAAMVNEDDGDSSRLEQAHAPIATVAR